jgi:T4 RnlA family RNA ligase
MKNIFINSKKIPTYDDCMNIVNSNSDTFFVKEETIDGVTISSFNYRLSKYSDFSEPYTRNLRGITFIKDTKELIALPLPKFFNYNENPFTESKLVDTWKPLYFTGKEDGSLVYFFIINNTIYCKTQNNSFSDQSVWSLQLVNKNDDLKKFIITSILEYNETPLFEFISPRNQVVIPYVNEELVLICTRNMVNGDINFHHNNTSLPNIKQTEIYNFNNINDMIELCNKNSDTLFEGYVVIFETLYGNEMVKFKTEEYLNLHRLKNNILIKENITNFILDGTIDDIKSTFPENIDLFNMINETEEIVIHNWNFVTKSIKDFYNENKSLNRKDYAISLTKYCKDKNKIIFTGAINMFLDKYNEKDIRDVFIKNKLWESKL